MARESSSAMSHAGLMRIDLRIVGTMQSCVARGPTTRFVALR